MGIFAEEDDNTLYFSRSDSDELLGSFSNNPFILDDAEWPSVEHYYQAMKFDDPAYQSKICSAETPKKARKMGRTRLKRRRSDWSSIKQVVMTRAIYTKCKTHSHVQEKLLETGNLRLVENSQYDYYWGCGRDRRGKNAYGEVLMRVREKLGKEITEQS